MLGLERFAQHCVDFVRGAARRATGIFESAEARYVRKGRIPWTPGYHQAKHRLISIVLSSPAQLDVFRSGGRLPAGYGFAFDERVVEYPWLISRLAAGPGRLLDAGSALNHGFVLDHPEIRSRQLHIVTLAPERSCFWQRSISYLFHDLRDIPIQSGYYDAVACISTLEHVGLDNSMPTRSTAFVENQADDWILAVHEMRRVLKGGGRLFVTVPYGRYRNFGTFQQFDRNLLERLVQAFQPAAKEIAFYRYRASGWQSAQAGECDDAEYEEWIMIPRDRRPARFPTTADQAAAARAVACLTLQKEG